jgi:hypothetical protein
MDMRTEYKKQKVRNVGDNDVLYSTQAQARNKSREARCSRVTSEEDQGIWTKSDIVQ